MRKPFASKRVPPILLTRTAGNAMKETTKTQVGERLYRDLPPSIREESREMILRPSQWPIWPLLPVKRYRLNRLLPECGVIYWGSLTDDPSETSKLTVTFRSIFDTDVRREEFEQIEYVNVDTLLDDGWEVD